MLDQEEAGRHPWELLEAMPTAIIVVGQDKRILQTNRLAEELFAYEREQLLGRDAEELVSESFRSLYRVSHSEILEKSDRVRLDLLGLGRDGRGFPAEVHLCRLAAGTGTCVLNVFRPTRAAESEMRPREQFENERKLLQQQLHQAQKMEVVGRLAGGVAHDFNNMLTVIGCYLELLLRELTPGDPRHEFAEQIHKASTKASWLALQLLTFSRRRSRTPRVLDLNSVVSDCLKILGRAIGEDIQLVARPAPDLGKVLADPGQIEQIIMNLAVHARDGMPNGGRFIVETSNADPSEDYVRTHMAPRPGGYVVLAVSGTGSGVEDRTRTRIFEPFVTAANEGRGTGLGFATIQGIVRQNSGDMVVEGGAGSGTTLKVYLPRTEEAQETEPPLQSDPAGGAETVLVVEDEWEVQNLLVKVLRATGYNVLAAKDSAEALDLSGVYAGPIHLLITDVVIPGISGCELAQALSRGRPELKVLYISGYAEEVVARHGIVDPDQFLQKPFRLDELMQKIRLSLDQPNTPS